MGDTSERQAVKVRHDAYRRAAKALLMERGFDGDVTVRDAVQVQEDADGSGAYLEVVIWVPKSRLSDV